MSTPIKTCNFSIVSNAISAPFCLRPPKFRFPKISYFFWTHDWWGTCFFSSFGPMHPVLSCEQSPGIWDGRNPSGPLAATVSDPVYRVVVKGGPLLQNKFSLAKNYNNLLQKTVPTCPSYLGRTGRTTGDCDLGLLALFFHRKWLDIEGKPTFHCWNTTESHILKFPAV